MNFRDILFSNFISQTRRDLDETKTDVQTSQNKLLIDRVLKLDNGLNLDFVQTEQLKLPDIRMLIVMYVFYCLGVVLANLLTKYLARNFSFKWCIILGAIGSWIFFTSLKTFPVGFLYIGICILGFFNSVVHVSGKFLVVEYTDLTKNSISEIEN